MPSDAIARAARQPRPATPIRVLHVVSESQRRGAELVALELADELDRLGHWNRVVALGPAFDGGRERGLEPLRDSWGQRPPDLVACARRLRRVIGGTSVDVVLAHGGWAAQVTACASPFRGPALIWQRILGFPDKVWGRGRRHWWATVVRRCDGVVALTPDQRDEVRRLGYRGPVWLVPNFRDSGRFRALDRDRARARLRGEVGVSEGTPLIGFVGHLAGQKRPERALEVLDRLRAQGSPAHLVVAGTGPLRTDLEARARHLGVDEAVTFLGQRDDIERVLGGVDVVLLTSEAEGIPGVAIEALMAGCPMVSVPVGGVSEVIEHGVTGLVLDDDRPEAMADAVAKLLADDESRAAMGRESRARTDRYTATAAAAVYVERFRDILATR